RAFRVRPRVRSAAAPALHPAGGGDADRPGPALGGDPPRGHDHRGRGRRGAFRELAESVRGAGGGGGRGARVTPPLLPDPSWASTSSGPSSTASTSTSRARCLRVGVLSGGYGREELERAGAYRVYEDPEDLMRHLDEIGVRSSLEVAVGEAGRGG